jgi:hypothetical protein
MLAFDANRHLERHLFGCTVIRQVRTTAGGFHVPLSMSSSGQQPRMYSENGPSRAGSQFDSASAPGDVALAAPAVATTPEHPGTIRVTLPQTPAVADSPSRIRPFTRGGRCYAPPPAKCRSTHTAAPLGHISGAQLRAPCLDVVRGTLTSTGGPVRNGDVFFS